MEQFTCYVVANPDNPGELVLDLGDEICHKMGWKPGDKMVWTDNDNGTWTLSKITPTNKET